MTKYICDVCNTEIEKTQLVRIKYSVPMGRSLIDDNFYSTRELFKDMCLVCAKKFITQRTIDEVVQAHIEKVKAREERRKGIKNDEG